MLRNVLRTINVIVRHFYAGSIQIKDPIPARLIKKGSCTLLETCEPYLEFADLKPKQFSNTTFRFWNFTKKNNYLVHKDSVWQWKLKLRADGKVICSKHSFDSTELLELLRKLKNNPQPILEQEHDGQLIGDEIAFLFAPDRLYAIDRTTWNGFIDQLPDQRTAGQLDLKTHRHLLPAYNYIISTKDPNKRLLRAATFSRYHFLQGYLPKHYWCTHLQGQDRLQYGKLKDNTLIRSIDSNCFEQTLQSQFIGRQPYLSMSYINKFAHAPHWALLSCIGTYCILPKATENHNTVNKRKLNSYIKLLPSSTQEPTQFANMVDDYLLLMRHAKLDWRREVGCNFFYHQRSHFGTYRSLNLSWDQYYNYVNTITKDLLYPEMIRRMLKGHYDNYNIKEQNDVDDLNYGLFNLAASFFSEYLPPKKFAELASQWQSNCDLLEKLKPPSKIPMSRHALFRQVTIHEGKSLPRGEYAYYPYPFLDENIQNKIYEAYLQINALPKALIASNYQEMISKLDIFDKLEAEFIERGYVGGYR